MVGITRLIRIELNKMNKRRRKNRVRLSLLILLSVAIPLVCSEWTPSSRAEDKGEPSSKSQQDVSEVSKTIVDLQPFRETSSIKIKGTRGEDGLATLINLNPNVNAWYLLRLSWRGMPEEEYHLENANPTAQRFFLDNNDPDGLVMAEKGNKYICTLWGAKSSHSLKGS